MTMMLSPASQFHSSTRQRTAGEVTIQSEEAQTERKVQRVSQIHVIFFQNPKVNWSEMGRLQFAFSVLKGAAGSKFEGRKYVHVM